MALSFGTTSAGSLPNISPEDINISSFGNIVSFSEYETTNKSKIQIILRQGCISPGRQLAWATNFFKVAPNICGSSVWSLLYVTLLPNKIFCCLLDFWKTFGHLSYTFDLNVLFKDPVN